MGSGAFMQVINSTQAPVTTQISNLSCMYDNGDEGSNLQLWNNATIPPGQSLPAGRQYIEAIGSGGCWFTPSYFTLSANGASITINAASGTWSSNPVPGIAVSITLGEQANIVVTVYVAGSPEAAAFEEPVAT